jgi:hypothetical protein
VGTTKNRPPQAAHPRDPTDAEGARIAPPIAADGDHAGGGQHLIDVRTGGQWRAIPKDSAARRTAKNALKKFNI